jgi:hypothetical protein
MRWLGYAQAEAAPHHRRHVADDTPPEEQQTRHLVPVINFYVVYEPKLKCDAALRKS